MTGFNCFGHAHRTARHVGLLRATVRALHHDLRTMLNDFEVPEPCVRRLFERDLRRAHQVLATTDGREKDGTN